MSENDLLEILGMAAVVSPVLWIILYLLFRKRKGREYFYLGLGGYVVIAILSLEDKPGCFGTSHFSGTGAMIIGGYSLLLFLSLLYLRTRNKG